MKFSGFLLLVFIILFPLGSALAGDDIVPEKDFVPNVTLTQKNKKTQKQPELPFLEKFFSPNLTKRLTLLDDKKVYEKNQANSYDTNFKYKFDLNLNHKKLELVPNIRISKTVEEKKQLFNEEVKIAETLQNSNEDISSESNSIFVGMDLSYALNNSIYLDSNLSFLQTDLEINQKDLTTKTETNAYKFKGNAMAVSIGVRKKLTDSFSAGLMYSWKKWLNETEEFGESEQDKENKASDEDQKALNLMLRYDF